jgi:hypothetical protein
MAKQEIEIPGRAIEDMRDVLEEQGFVNAQRAPEAKVIKKIDQLWGLEKWLRYYGHLG